MVDIQSVTTENRRGKKGRRNHRSKNRMSACTTQGGHNQQWRSRTAQCAQMSYNTEQFWSSFQLSSRQSSLFRCCLLDGRGIYILINNLTNNLNFKNEVNKKTLI